MSLETIMTKNVITLGPKNTIRDACALMYQYGIGFLPITQDHELVGLVTDRDIVLAIANLKKTNTELREIMTKNIHSNSVKDSIYDVAETMSYYQVKRVPILEEKKLVGVISLSDITRVNQDMEIASDILAELTYDVKRDFHYPLEGLKIDDFDL